MKMGTRKLIIWADNFPGIYIKELVKNPVLFPISWENRCKYKCGVCCRCYM